MFDIIPMQMCKSIDGPIRVEVDGYIVDNLFSERHYPTCSCAGYKFSKHTIDFGGRMVPPPCKHISKAEKSVCGWHQQFSDEVQETVGVCPKCGGDAVGVLVGV